MALLLLPLAVARRWLALAPPTAGRLFGGALANLLDRAADGRVTDLLEVGRWPTFNLADTELLDGVDQEPRQMVLSQPLAHARR